MAIFELRRDKNPIIKTINKSNDFIDIVAFQFTSDEIAELLAGKASQGVSIRIITLPEDSFGKVSDRQKIRELYDSLIGQGVELNRCIWEVGAPELTDTSLSGEQTEGGGNKWYSLHGKFMVTDTNALALSANLTDETQLEVYLTYDDNNTIEKFRKKYEQIKKLFCTEYEGLPGSLFQQLPTSLQKEVASMHKSLKRINVKEYPPDLTPDISLDEGLFLSPFDGRARTFLHSIIEQAEEFIYLSTERLFDDLVVKQLLQKAYNSDIPIKILTGHPRAVRQNPAKAEKMAYDLMAAGVEFAIAADIHAKLWLTEKHMCVGSANLGKMNLGFSKSANHWRANTETLWIDSNKGIIRSAKSLFNKEFQNTPSGIVPLSDVSTKINRAKDLFALFGYRSRKEAKILMARIETQFNIENRQNIIRIAKLSARLAEIEKGRYITEENVIMANILFYLRERKHDLGEIKEKMERIIDKNKIEEAIKKLLKQKYISKEHEYYTINIERLLVRESKNPNVYED